MRSLKTKEIFPGIQGASRLQTRFEHELEHPRLRRHPTLVDHFPNISFWGFPQEAGP